MLSQPGPQGHTPLCRSHLCHPIFQSCCGGTRVILAPTRKAASISHLPIRPEHGAEHWSHERDPMTETGMKGLSRQGMALSPPPPGLPSTQQEAQVPGSSTGKGITLNHSYAQPHLRPTAPPTGQRQLRSRPPWPEPQTMAFWNILSRSIAVVYCPLPGNQRWLIHFYFF